MSKQDRLATTDMAEDMPQGQTSNKAGLHSDARKPSNAGPDSHEEHKAPVAGAFTNEEKRDEEGEQRSKMGLPPRDKART